jgi:hypothetical protein
LGLQRRHSGFYVFPEMPNINQEEDEKAKQELQSSALSIHCLVRVSGFCLYGVRNGFQFFCDFAAQKGAAIDTSTKIC